MFCLQIHARTESTKNEKFCMLHEAAGPSAVSKILSSFYIQQVRVFVSKTRNLTVSNTFNI